MIEKRESQEKSCLAEDISRIPSFWELKKHGAFELLDAVEKNVMESLFEDALKADLNRVHTGLRPEIAEFRFVETDDSSAYLLSLKIFPTPEGFYDWEAYFGRKGAGRRKTARNTRLSARKRDHASASFLSALLDSEKANLKAWPHKLLDAEAKPEASWEIEAKFLSGQEMRFSGKNAFPSRWPQFCTAVSPLLAIDGIRAVPAAPSEAQILKEGAAADSRIAEEGNASEPKAG